MKVQIFTSEALSKMAELSSHSVDLCLTDVPYGETAQEWDKLINITPMWKQLKRVMKKDSAIILFAQNIYQARLIVSQEKAYKFKYFWKKNRAANCHQAKIQPLRNCEEILIFSFGKLPYFPQKSIGHKPTSPAVRKQGSTSVYRQARTFLNNGGATDRYPKTVLDFDCVDNNSPERVHSNQKPVSLLQHLIRQHSQPGETVLDFCCGSGSAGVAAILEKRNFIGIDQNEIYTNYARQWIAKVNGTSPDLTNFMVNKTNSPLFERGTA